MVTDLDLETGLYWLWTTKITIFSDNVSLHTESYDDIPALVDTATTVLRLPPYFYAYLATMSECGKENDLRLEMELRGWGGRSLVVIKEEEMYNGACELMVAPATDVGEML